MSDPDSATPFFHVSSDNHGPWVIVTSYTFLIFSIMFVVTKIFSRFKLSKLTLGDGFVLMATVLAFMQTIFMTYACNHGFGRHMNTLDVASLDAYGKYHYAAELFQLPAQAFTKAAVIHFIMLLSPHMRVLRLCQVLLFVIALWATSGVFALAFRCELPKPWHAAPGRCVDQRALYTTLGTINVITDVALIVLPIYMVWNVQIPSSVKWQVFSLFSFRIFVPVFMILNLVALQSVYSPHADRTWVGVLPTIYSQIMLHLAILTACLPNLKRIIDTFRSGTAAVCIDGPYQLITSGRGHILLAGSKIKDGSGTSKERESGLNSAMGSGGLGSAASKHGGYGNNKSHHGEYMISRMSSIMSARGEDKTKNYPERSDSLKALTDNIVVQTAEDKIEFDDHSQRDAMTLHSGDGASNR